MPNNYSQKVVLTQNVLAKDYHWLDRDYSKGEEFFVYRGFTYGCVSVNGIACTERLGEEPFFELPKIALKKCGINIQ